MDKNLPDIIYGINENKSPYVDSATSLHTIPFFKPEEYFNNLESINHFITGVEKLVRTSDRYSKYKSYLMNEVQLNHCQVLSDLSDLDCEIELHHGPIFTLYDTCSVILEYFLMKKWKITSFRIADQVLTEHEENRVNCVMLSSTIHEEVHNRDIFINMKHAWGDINGFINKYYDVISPELRNKYNRYIDASIMRDSDDHGILELSQNLFPE